MMRHMSTSMRPIDHTNIAKTKCILATNFKEHSNLDIPSGVGDHCQASDHSVDLGPMHHSLTVTLTGPKVKEAYINRPGMPEACYKPFLFSLTHAFTDLASFNSKYQRHF